MAMFQVWTQMNQQQSPAKAPPPPPPPKVPVLKDPRVGGQDDEGVWTGYGQQGEGLEPNSLECYRAFKFAKDKALLMRRNTEEKIKQGLSDTNFHFTMPLEDGKNCTSLIDKLKKWEHYAHGFGLEAVFHIIARDGRTINMFREPGKLTEAIVKTWCEDLAKGVVTGFKLDGTPNRSDPCSYDKTINTLTAEALKNSSSVKMQGEIDRHAKGTLSVGPYVLWVIINTGEASSSSVIRDLCDKLQSIEVKQIPGENLKEYAVQAQNIVDDIRSKCLKDEPDDLTQLCLHGLTECSDEGIRSLTRDLINKADAVGSTLTPEAALKNITSAYDLAIKRKLYAPHKAQATSSGFTASTNVPAPAPTAAPVGTPLDPHMVAAMAAAMTAALERTSSTYQGRPRGQGRSNGNGRPARDSNSASGGNSSSSGGNGTSGSTGQPNQRGLSVEESRRINRLIGDYQLPAYNSISDTDKIEVKDPDRNNEVVGQCCKICRRIIKKGPSMHWTGTHQRRSDRNNSNNNHNSNNSNNNNSGGSNTGISEAQTAAIQAAVQHALQAAQAPAPAPSSGAPLLQLRGANYETRPTTNMFLCDSLAGYLPAEDGDDASFASASSHLNA